MESVQENANIDSLKIVFCIAAIKNYQMNLSAPKMKAGAWMFMGVNMWMLNKIQNRIRGNIWLPT